MMNSPLPLKIQLEAYEVHPQRGFLPTHDPITSLPAPFDVYDAIALELPKQLCIGRIDILLADLPQLDTQLLTQLDQLDRAMLLLSYFAHAYIQNQQPLKASLPANIAVPWYQVSQRLGRPPILSYASHDLYNWRRFDRDQAIELGNIARLQDFLGGMDDDWFVLVHVAIEAKAGAGILAMVRAQDAAIEGEMETVAKELEAVAHSVRAMLTTLKRLPERCDPYIYYNRVRMFLFGWKDNPALPNGMLYEGVEAYAGQPQKFSGETGAQSSVIPFFDQALGISDENDPLANFMHSLRDYMPPRHRAFIEEVGTRVSVRNFVLSHYLNHPPLRDAYNLCINEMALFRKTHLDYAAAYIHKQSQRLDANSSSTGTGGTPFMGYLKQHLDNLKDHAIV
jgi:indoleamine 2,3-dioxygenase